ncbi:MAG TPA: hypothetical protein VFS76_26580 [Pyrinomonadaceae bacterium]|nr:hypothetical protein [Pyrinomonadaceae bacterium]
MKAPAAIVVAQFVLLATACGGHSTINVSPPQGSGAPSGSSGPAANQPTSHASPAVDTPGQDCDPNYDPCVPIATDVDCAGGRGNGPEYVQGPVKVVGKDIYGLDKDNNGIGCE